MEGKGRPGGVRVVALPTGPPREMAGLRWRVVDGDLIGGDLESLGDRGSGKREKEPERRRLMRSLTAGSL